MPLLKPWGEGSNKWKSHVVPRLYSLFTRGGDIHDLIPQVDDSSLYLDWGHERVVEYLPLGDTESLDRAVELLHACCIGAMHDASPPGKRPPGFRSAPWWNEECRAHILAIMHATGDEKEYLRSRSRPLFRRIKREYYTSICEAANPANIWSLAKWGMGTRTTPIPPLRDGPGFAATPESRADLFLRTFFPPPPPSADHPNPVI